jgi:hypothetical protein
VDKLGYHLVFSTGPEIASASISGVVFDWPAGHPAPNALVEAVSHPDSTVYIDRADSVGRFTISHMPAGSFTVIGWVDANSNHDLDPHELQDSTTVTLKDTARVELLAFVHDSIGPHVVTVEVRDSLTLHASFDKPVDPAQALDSAHIMLRAADSSLIRTKAIVSAREIDKQRADSAARADSIRARRDTAFRRQYQQQHRAPTDSNAIAALRRSAELATNKTSKPIPVSDILISLEQPLTAGATYRVEAKDIHNLMGVAASSIRSFTVPKPTPPPPPPPPPRSRPTPPGAKPAAPAPARTDTSTAKPPA